MSTFPPIPHKVLALFKDFKFLEGNAPIMQGRIPDKLMQEIGSFVDICRSIKSQELFYLLRQRTTVSDNFSHVPVPTVAFENSFTQAFLIYLGEYVQSQIFGEAHRREFRVKKYDGHFNGYDFWTCFYNVGDYVPRHQHFAVFSGVIYYTDGAEPTEFQNGVKYLGKKGDILIFPSELVHWVDAVSQERVTLSFNLI